MNTPSAIIKEAMNCPKDCFIDDYTSILIKVDGNLILNKNYEKERAYYERVWEEAQLTKEVL